MTGEGSADRIHRSKSRVHHVGAAASMNVGIDESGDNGKPQGIDVLGIRRQSQVREQSNGIDSAVSNDDSARREFFNGTQDGTRVDDQNAITHARYPDAPGLCEGCRRLR